MPGPLAAAAALLLALAGLAKLRAPVPAAAMLTQAWRPLRTVPALPLAIRLGGVGEAAIGVGVLAHGGRIPSTLLAACYFVFALVALRLTFARRRVSCGCFGRADSPVGPMHVAVDVGCLAVAVAAAVQPPGPLGGVFTHGALVSAIGAGQIVLLAWLAFLSITALPALAAECRRVLESR